MPAGTPLTMKCPNCNRGKYGYPSQVQGVRATGEVELTVTVSKHRGAGKGGAGFVGHRGLVQCRDCGHRWFSTHPASGRKRHKSECGCP